MDLLKVNLYKFSFSNCNTLKGSKLLFLSLHYECMQISTEFCDGREWEYEKYKKKSTPINWMAQIRHFYALKQILNEPVDKQSPWRASDGNHVLMCQMFLTYVKDGSCDSYSVWCLHFIKHPKTSESAEERRIKSYSAFSFNWSEHLSFVLFTAFKSRITDHQYY